MPIETELKLRVASHEPVRERLKALRATHLGCVVESNLILDRTDGWLRRQGCGLRLRSTVDSTRRESQVTLTFKGPRRGGPLKRREELEVKVGDAGTVETMLYRLGFTRILEYQKKRESWQLGACRIELDEPPHIGLFVEIEGPDEPAIREAQRQLHLIDAEQEPRSYVAMLAAYCDEAGVADRTLALPGTA